MLNTKILESGTFNKMKVQLKYNTLKIFPEVLTMVKGLTSDVYLISVNDTSVAFKSSFNSLVA